MIVESRAFFFFLHAFPCVIDIASNVWRALDHVSIVCFRTYYEQVSIIHLFSFPLPVILKRVPILILFYGFIDVIHILARYGC